MALRLNFVNIFIAEIAGQSLFARYGVFCYAIFAVYALLFYAHVRKFDREYLRTELTNRTATKIEWCIKMNSFNIASQLS